MHHMGAWTASLTDSPAGVVLFVVMQSIPYTGSRYVTTLLCSHSADPVPQRWNGNFFIDQTLFDLGLSYQLSHDTSNPCLCPLHPSASHSLIFPEHIQCRSLTAFATRTVYSLATITFNSSVSDGFQLPGLALALSSHSGSLISSISSKPGARSICMTSMFLLSWHPTMVWEPPLYIIPFIYFHITNSGTTVSLQQTIPGVEDLGILATGLPQRGHPYSRWTWCTSSWVIGRWVPHLSSPR